MEGSEEVFEDFELLAEVLWMRAASDPRLRDLLPGSLEELSRIVEDRVYWDLKDTLLRSVGIWTYDFTGWVYGRVGLCAIRSAWKSSTRIPRFVYWMACCLCAFEIAFSWPQVSLCR